MIGGQHGASGACGCAGGGESAFFFCGRADCHAGFQGKDIRNAPELSVPVFSVSEKRRGVPSCLLVYPVRWSAQEDDKS